MSQRHSQVDSQPSPARASGLRVLVSHFVARQHLQGRYKKVAPAQARPLWRPATTKTSVPCLQLTSSLDHCDAVDTCASWRPGLTEHNVPHCAGPPQNRHKSPCERRHKLVPCGTFVRPLEIAAGGGLVSQAWQLIRCLAFAAMHACCPRYTYGLLQHSTVQVRVVAVRLQTAGTEGASP